MKLNVNALVIEDNPHMQLLLGEMLRGLGAGKVATVANLSAARDEMGWKRYDVALVDVGLGAESGLDFVESVRRDRRSVHRRMPMMVISGQGQKSVIEAARDVGADAFLVKPVSRGAVVEGVNRLIFEPRPYVESSSFFGPDRRWRRDRNYKGPERRGGGSTFELD